MLIYCVVIGYNCVDSTGTLVDVRAAAVTDVPRNAVTCIAVGGVGACTVVPVVCTSSGSLHII